MTARSILTGSGARGARAGGFFDAGLADVLADDLADPFAGALAGRRPEADDREVWGVREPEPVALRAGEVVREAMGGEPTAEVTRATPVTPVTWVRTWARRGAPRSRRVARRVYVKQHQRRYGPLPEGTKPQVAMILASRWCCFTYIGRQISGRQISMTTGMIIGRRRRRRFSHGPIARRTVCCSAIVSS